MESGQSVARSHASGWLVAGVVAALVLALLPSTVPFGGETPSAEARARKCQFAKRQDNDGATWTLKKSCTTKRMITIPDGVTLDGGGKTIRLTGRSVAYPEGAGIFAAGPAANLKNLTVDNRTLCGTGPLPFMIEFHDVAGEIRDVRLINSQAARCSEGAILVSGTAGRATDIRFASVEGAIHYLGDSSPPVPHQVAGTVANAAVSRSPGLSAIKVEGGDLTVLHTTIDDSVAGVEIGLASSATVSNNTMRDVNLGVGVAPAMAADITGNTIVGLGNETLGVPMGISHGGSGTIAGNAISNYFDPGPDVGCGIFVPFDSTATIGANTFPDPPGNEQDVCEFRPT